MIIRWKRILISCVLFSDSYVIIENSKPDVTGEATAKADNVYWKKLPINSSSSDNFLNPRLKIKVISFT